MDRRLPIAIGLMIALMVLSNLLFPPISAPPSAPSPGQDSLVIVGDGPALRSPVVDETRTPSELMTEDGVGTETESAVGKIITVTWTSRFPVLKTGSQAFNWTLSCVASVKRSSGQLWLNLARPASKSYVRCSPRFRDLRKKFRHGLQECCEPQSILKKLVL